MQSSNPPETDEERARQEIEALVEAHLQRQAEKRRRELANNPLLRGSRNQSPREEQTH